MFKLRIVTPEKIVFEGKSNYLAINTDEGEQVILPGHAAYMCQVEIGELRYKDDKGELHPYAVSSGFLQIKDGKIDVLLDDATHSKDIDIQKAEEAKKRAEEMLVKMDTQTDINRLKSQIKLANIHISTVKKYRSHKTTPTEEIDR